MGYKAYVIIIKGCEDVDAISLLESLGKRNPKPVKSTSFEAAIHPTDGLTYIGKYLDMLLICDVDMATNFVTPELTKEEQYLIHRFPDAEICAINLHSGVNYWGYSIIRDGQKIRARAGSSEDGTYLDLGEPLEEELELLSKSTMDENGQRTYILEDFPGESFTEDQVGENFVFSIWGRYFGEWLDEMPREVLDLPMTTGFKSKGRVWWRFW